MCHPRLLVALVAMTGCIGSLPPPPELRVTSPERGLMQDLGQIVVEGTTQPNIDGDPVARVMVNDVPATLAADGSFRAVLHIPDGATLLETVATTDTGGYATDTRAVQIGERHAVGTTIDRAVTTAVSARAFAKLASAAGPLVRDMNLASKLAPVMFGDSLANVRLTVQDLRFGDVTFALTPVDGGLTFSVALEGLTVGALAAYGGSFIPSGTSIIGVTADRVTLAGTLTITPGGATGFSASVSSTSVQTAGLRLQASGIAGQILRLLNDNLSSTVQRVTSDLAARGLEPLLNAAFGALDGPKQVEVLGKTLTFEASPAAIAFDRDGALVTMNVAASLAGSERSRGFIMTPNGTPAMDPAAGLQLGVADELLNQMLAEIHAIGALDVHLVKDFGIADTLDIQPAMPPMVSANDADGSLRVVLGDMIATLSRDGTPVVRAALNAQVDVQVVRGTGPQQVGVKLDDIDLRVNVIPDPTKPNDGSFDLASVAAGGIGVQLASLDAFFVNVPLPSVAGVSLEDLSMHADSGYAIITGELR